MPQRPQEAELLIPASVSNLGPGFDALSVAVQLYMRVRIVELLPESPGVFDAAFVGPPPGGENRIEAAFRHAAARAGGAQPCGMRIEIGSDIPAGAGLGSSGAATIAGLRLYEIATSRLPRERLLAMANEMEGHPDNAAASLLGGLTVSCVHDDGRVTALSGRWPAEVRLVVATPDAGLDTARARSILPATVPLEDAVFNLQRALLLLRALESGAYGDVREAMRDRWHQRIRASLVPGLDAALALDDPEILGVCLSGSGPSIVALATTGTAVAERRLRDIYRGLGVAATIRTLSAHQPSSSEHL
jgi:homoserine kinase